LGDGQPRDDKVLLPGEVSELLAGNVVVEEKVDGANVGFSMDEDGVLRAQNRGSYLTPERAHPQFKPLFRWLSAHEREISDALFPDLILFGEWCYAVHTVPYTKLPSWFLAFDVYDRSKREFWSTANRDALVAQLGLSVVPRLAKGHFDIPGLYVFLQESRLTDGPPEGLYVRRETRERLLMRAKLVRPDFVQAIGVHWSRQPIRANMLVAE
jgi:ATP-dependent RNA circularization protein (DNA/RNA ligase family)